jgi:hypothetical protein
MIFFYGRLSLLPTYYAPYYPFFVYLVIRSNLLNFSQRRRVFLYGSYPVIYNLIYLIHLMRNMYTEATFYLFMKTIQQNLWFVACICVLNLFRLYGYRVMHGSQLSRDGSRWALWPSLTPILLHWS